MSSWEEMFYGCLSVISIERIDDFHIVRFVHDDGDSATCKSFSENDFVLLLKDPPQKSNHEVHMVGKSNQHTHRDPFDDPVPEKSITASYGGSEHDSNLSRNMAMGVGRTDGSLTELGHRSLYNKAAAGVSGTISGQRNGVGIKHSFSNTEATTISDAQHQPTRNLITES